MFELANTSLPNGLIPGTHGFATVAMTKGLPDALRQRLEALCAYTHRQSAHDDRYFRENPVNWFHVALPTGEHAVGRVAACDFDYTGRTNRLARMLVFPAREMPRTGAARVLSAEKARFSAPWEGEPRWLAPDAATATRLASSAAPVGANPSAWTAKFGADGVALAQRFALLLEKSVRDGGKPIYFKTSATSDPDGTGLLSLFADLIDLLPPDLRLSVTFSTYPDALPNGTRCHLRGAFDGDRAFAAASALQPWVDCEQGRVMHEEMLPAPKAPPRPVAPTPATSARPTHPTDAPSATHTPGAGAAQPRSQSYFPTPTQAKWLPPEKKNSERNFYIILGSVAAVVVVAFAAGLWLMQKKPVVVPLTDVEEADGADSDAIARRKKEKEELDALEAAQGKQEEDRKAAAEKAEEQWAAATNVAESIALPEAPVAEEAGKTQQTEMESPEAVSELQPKFEFMRATKFEVVEINRFDDTAFIKAHQMMTTFYYDDGECEELVKGKSVERKKAEHSIFYSPKLNSFTRESKGRFVIFYDSETNEAFWLWLLPADAEKGEKWFGSEESDEPYNLQRKVFGSETSVFDFYKKNAGEPTYTVTRSDGEASVGGIKLETEKKTSEAKALLNLFVPDSAVMLMERTALEQHVNDAEEMLNGVRESVNKFNKDASDFEVEVGKLKKAIGQLNSIEENFRKEKDKKKKAALEGQKKKAEGEVSGQAKLVSRKSQDLARQLGLSSVDERVLIHSDSGDAVDGLLKDRMFFIQDKDGKLKVKRRDEAAEREVLNEKYERAKQDLGNFDAQWKDKWRKRVKESKFAITEVSGSNEKKGAAQ